MPVDLLLQETISAQLESKKQVFVAYFDVSKAFDGIWINGLFYRLHSLGIKGKTWRLLYKCYTNFSARVRIHNKFSKSYNMDCGIHQGGYLSLFKYVAFIDTLLKELENSNLCCVLGNINTTPLGYADDIASATLSKLAMDQVLNIAHLHSLKWRYNFNAKKCAIVVYGETERNNKVNSKDRMYRLGHERVKETYSYEHLGLTSYNSHNHTERTIDKVSKGRRALSAASGIGIKHGGISMKACNIVFWSVVVPTITFASELWILDDTDIGILDDFQKYAGRRVQRLHPKSPSVTSFPGLGWIRLENYINIKKLLFLRTIIVLKDEEVHKRVLCQRLEQFVNNTVICTRNTHQSPIFDILRIAQIYGLFDDLMRMLNGTHHISKAMWRRKVWENAWQIEDRDWVLRAQYFGNSYIFCKTINGPVYSIWWKLADRTPKLIRPCEVMMKLLCGASRLKVDDYRVRNENAGNVMCNLCNNYAREDPFHIIMQCEGTQNIRGAMHTALNELLRNTEYSALLQSPEIFYIMMGKDPGDVPEEIMFEVWATVCVYVTKMYWTVLNNRIGIG